MNEIPLDDERFGTEIQAGNYVLSRTSDNIRVFVDLKDETENRKFANHSVEN
ncbi:hypothetical protein [Peribacillus aracenensis]|uniref:hypothetical protein n=1 Tax=Peribacillus aracenensis TaxID=2976708 RepID=UPI0021A282CC|nr:hypothetical protein [Peribacillus sp. BBB004]